MVTIQVPTLWKSRVGGLNHIEVTSACLSDAVREMAERYPALRPQLSEAGEIQGALNLFINGEHIRYRGGLAAPLQDGDVVHIVPIISGGSR